MQRFSEKAPASVESDTDALIVRRYDFHLRVLFRVLCKRLENRISIAAEIRRQNGYPDFYRFSGFFEIGNQRIQCLSFEMEPGCFNYNFCCQIRAVIQKIVFFQSRVP